MVQTMTACYVQVQITITPVAAGEYDAALANAPQLCRSLAAASGDLRSAGECIAG